MWVSAAPGGITGFDFVIVGLGIVADIASYSSSAWYYRERSVAA